MQHAVRCVLSLGGSWLLALLPAASQQPVAQLKLTAPPALAQVRQAYAAVHPRRAPTCGDGTLLFSLGSPQNVFACLVGDDELTLRYGRTTTTLRLEQYSSSYYRFAAYAGPRQVGTVVHCVRQGDEVSCFDLTLSKRSLGAALGGLTEARFVALDDSAFRPAVRRVLAQGATTSAGAYFAPTTLNNKGYCLQQLGYHTEARLFFDEVLRRYPTRAVAYLNRGDTHWKLNQLAAAQDDYRRYLALLHTQHKDTSRVPAYVRLILRLPRH